MKIEITKPLEAVHKKTGRVVPVTFIRPWSAGGFVARPCPEPDQTNDLWKEDGTDYCFKNLWFVRNVAVSKIDTTKPLQLTDGTPAVFDSIDSDGDIFAIVNGKPCVFNPRTGKHLYGVVADLINVPSTENTTMKLDLDLPLQLTDGTPVRLTRPNYSSKYFEAEILAGGGHSAGQRRLFLKDSGAHINGRLPNVTNVVGGLDISKPLQTRGGNSVTLEGKLPDGRLVVSVRELFNGSVTKIVPASGRVYSNPTMESADDIINKPSPLVTVYRNVYADGTVGDTAHGTMDAVRHATKYNKVRIGILKQTTRDGLLVHAAVMPEAPFKRTSAEPKGVANPWA